MENKEKTLLLKNGKDVYGEKIDILIVGEKIEKISEEISGKDAENLKIIDLKGNLVMPGIIDVHTHMREPGITHKEDFETGSRACAKGGITTFYDMPNTVPPTVTLENLIIKKKAAAEKSIVNFGFHFGGSKNNNIEEIRKVLKEKEANTVKIFMNVTTGEMLIEDEELLKEIFRNSDLVPVHAEHEMIDKALLLNKEYGHGLYVCHIPSKEELVKVIEAKKNPEMNNEKHPVYVEVTPHHLFLNEKIRESSERNKMLLRMKPELRTEQDNEFLWKALINGDIDTVGTDHAPHLISEKLEKVTFGMPGVETSLALMLTEYNKGKITLEKIQKVMCENPAKIMKIEKRGKLKEGYYADIIVIDLNKEWIVKNEDCESKCKWSPYENWKLKGKNIMTVVNGNIVYENEKIRENEGKGRNVEVK
ncbi:dihydroorotase [Pseudoleptotrichia goodfellowii]|uniref:Amidohydrolase family protein n=1 Tax=Pseudoleptotrichia goodfellowii F0264 TaxID=596323 RepID=D0GKJ3_9FUSO|nr:dihydroorotase family protein [Pseudoleptotrichia goodfellowii]EEY35392.1 amidohydrolase family protein [Pseudoleptotrichia goodfellowii F0264]